MANNNYPQITSVTSEALQAQIRNLLPSQEGFGTDLMAQNVIVPIIDLTRAAEGSTVPQNLQTSLAFGSQTAFSANNSTVVIANTAGFYRVYGIMTCVANRESKIDLSDGLSVKTILSLRIGAANLTDQNQIFDFTVFLRSGDSISAVSGDVNNYVNGSSRQIADVNGNLVNPVGFNPQ